jgi:hypothetical protein
MSWLRTKTNAGAEPDHDPCIDHARQVLGKSQSATPESGRRREHTADMPRGVDADFCYGGETNPCA